jgi:hypothetical protein
VPVVQERPELSSLEGYGLFLLRADALEKEQATYLEPSSLILPLSLSLKVPTLASSSSSSALSLTTEAHS